MKITSFVSTILQTLKPTVGWMRDHPLKSCGFTSLFTFLACLIGECEPIQFHLAGVSVICLIWFGLVMSRDLRKKAMVALVVFCLFCESAPIYAQVEPQSEIRPAAGQVIAGVVVVVVGAVVYIYLSRTCQRVFNRPPPRNTNAEPFHALSSLSDDYAASWAYYPYGSCEPVGSMSELPTTAMLLTGSFVQTTSGLEVRLDGQKIVQEDLVDGPTFQRLLQAHGVPAGGGVGDRFYGRNGRPATAEEVPIYFWEEDGQHNVSCVAGGDPVPVAIERSPDLTRWEALTSVTVSAGQRIALHDTTTATQMFYRFRKQ